MKSFTYYAEFEPGERRGITVSFPDVPEAITQGDDKADALLQAREALGLALLTYPERGMKLPRPRAKAPGLIPITVIPEDAAKLAVLDAFRNAGIGKSELARRMGKDEKEVRRILDPKHNSKIGVLAEALEALGQRLVVGVENAA